MDELDLWILDQLERGLAGFQTVAREQCGLAARRLVDAKASGLASRVEQLPVALFGLPEPLRADFLIEKLGELHLKAEILRLTAYRGLSTVQKYGQPGPEGSLTKWMWSETNQQLTQFAADLLGTRALQADDRWAYELLRARGNSIEGGTTEVLKNIVAERVLGLPKAR